jgi:AcrR family transcriptional regulator
VSSVSSQPAPPLSRRDQILEAACRVIAEVGIDRLRMSDVAALAGVSTALVHYYCATRDDLLQQAFAFADERAALAERRITDTDLSPLDQIEQLLLLYLDDTSEIYESWILWREMMSHAIFDPTLRPVMHQAYTGWVEGFAEIVRAGQADGSIPGSTDPEGAGWRLTALVEGLGPVALVGLRTREQGVALIRDAVALELGIAGRD